MVAMLPPDFVAELLRDDFKAEQAAAYKAAGYTGTVPAYIAAEAAVGRNMRDLVEEGVFDRSVTLEVIRTGCPIHMLQSRRGRKLVLTGTPGGPGCTRVPGNGGLLRAIA